MTDKQIEAELRLFKSYTIDDLEEARKYSSSLNNQEVYSKGLIFDGIVNQAVIDKAIEMYGKKPEEWNATFHKSFSTVKNTPIEVLVAQQIMHYITTYGFENLGIYNQDLVYIPYEALEIPELEEDIPMVVIHNINAEQLNERLLNLLTSGIALSKQTVQDVMELSDYIDVDRFDEIVNKEVKIALYDKYGVVPKNNVDFLRYLVFKTTGSTLLIQSRDLIKSIKNSDIEKPYEYLSTYVSRNNGYKKLAEIFLRYKDIFIAFRRREGKYAKSINKILNKVRKMADTYHKALPVNILDRLTSIYGVICGGHIFRFHYNEKTAKKVEDIETVVDDETILQLLDNVPVFREIRILNSIRYRLNENSSVAVYKIRNGKTYIDNLDKKMDSDKLEAQRLLEKLISNHLEARLAKQLRDKTVFIPENIDYKAPTSEKQFIGNIPIGTTIEAPRTKNMIIGVHWKNLGGDDDSYYSGNRVDLDLHMVNQQEHYGWNGSYSSDRIVYSGDVTDAKLPNGATECFLISKNVDRTEFLVKLKKFTSNKQDVPYEIIIASTDDDEVEKNYVINPNNVLAIINCKFEYDPNVITSPDIDLGNVIVEDDKIIMQFANYSADNTIAGYDKDRVGKILDYSKEYSKSQLSLNRLLIDAECELSLNPTVEKLEEVVVKDKDTNKEEVLFRKVNKPVDYDLSLEKISKDTIINILTEIK